MPTRLLVDVVVVQLVVLVAVTTIQEMGMATVADKHQKSKVTTGYQTTWTIGFEDTITAVRTKSRNKGLLSWRRSEACPHVHAPCVCVAHTSRYDISPDCGTEWDEQAGQFGGPRLHVNEQ